MDDDSTWTYFSTNKNTVLLQTAYTEIRNPNHSQKTNARLLFYLRSPRSYISKTLQEELKLPIIRTENLKIKVFGSNKFKLEKVDIVLLILVGNKKLVIIEAICSPRFCSELNNQHVFCATENYTHLQDLLLADNIHHENKKTDLLIGMDYYSCVSGAQIKGQPKEPIALSSIFEWIICGCYENSKSAYSNICHLLRVNTETRYSNYKINPANACDSFDTNFNNKLSRGKVIEKEQVVIYGNIDTKHEYLPIIEYFSENIGCRDNLYCVKLPFKEIRETTPDNLILAT